jgi:hypothetical protein
MMVVFAVCFGLLLFATPMLHTSAASAMFVAAPFEYLSNFDISSFGCRIQSVVVTLVVVIFFRYVHLNFEKLVCSGKNASPFRPIAKSVSAIIFALILPAFQIVIAPYVYWLYFRFGNAGGCLGYVEYYFDLWIFIALNYLLSIVVSEVGSIKRRDSTV